MKKIISTLALSLIMMMPFLANAEGRIAVLDIEAAILQTELAKKEFKSLQERADVADNMKQLESLQQAYNEKVEQLKKDSAILSNEKKQEEAQKLQNSLTDIQHVRKKLQSAEQELAKKLLQALSPKLNQIVPEIIKSEGIGMLLHRKAVMHADSNYDITAQVTAKLNM